MEWTAVFWRRASSAEMRRRLLWAALFLSVLLLFLQWGPIWFFDPRRGNAPDHVILYTTRWCPACERLRQCLRRQGVPFEERDVEVSWRAATEWSALDGDRVPLTLVGQRVAYGMRQGELETALGAAGFRVDCWGAGAVIDLRESSRLRSAQ